MKFICCTILLLSYAIPSLGLDLGLSSWDQMQDPRQSIDKMEWWYNIAILQGTDAQGNPRKFGVMYNFARSTSLAGFYPLNYPVASRNIQILLLDYSDGFDHQAFRLQADVEDLDPQTMSVSENNDTFATRTENQLGAMEANLNGIGEDFEVHLHIRNQKPQALFGDQGYVTNGSLGKAMYVSRTSESVEPDSKIVIAGEEIAVTGINWEDHQLTKVTTSPVTWSWFAIVLKDGTEVMAYKLSNALTGAEYRSYAGHVLADGSVEDVNFSVEELAPQSFTNQVTTRMVPTEWNIAIPELDIQSHIAHELPLPYYNVVGGALHGTFFEGPCRIDDDNNKISQVWAEYFNSLLFGVVP